MINAEIRLDFVIVGASKGGSTTLWNALRLHPSICLPETKELNYFGSDKSVVELNTFFEDCANGQTLKGECTPYYLSSKDAAAHLYRNNPSLKVMMVLRDPVERAWSQFQFDKAIAIRPRRQTLPDAINESPCHRRHMLVDHGYYSQWIQMYRSRFSSDSVLTLTSDELRNFPSATIERIEDFLGVPRSGRFQLSDENVTSIPSGHIRRLILGVARRTRGPLDKIGLTRRAPSYTNRYGPVLQAARSFLLNGKPEPMSSADREALEAIYADEYVRLGALLDRESAPWVSDSPPA